MSGHIKIYINLKNEKTGRQLAEQLAFLERGLEVYADGSNADPPADPDFVVTDEILAEHFPADRLLDYIIDTCIAEGGLHRPAKEKACKVISIFSPCGGSGCTCLALTLGRILAGRGTGKVCLVLASPSVEDDIYLLGESSQRNPEGELEFILSNNMKRNLRMYMRRDSSGLLAVKCKTEVNRLIDRLRKEDDFEYVLVDGGCSSCLRDFDYNIRVMSVRDSRCEALLAEDNTGRQVITVLNQSGYREKTPDKVRIPLDMESFAAHEGKVEISMKGAFAESVAAIAEIVCGEELY